MNIGIVCWNIDVDKYFKATCDSIASVYNNKNNILLVVHRSSVESVKKIVEIHPNIEVLIECSWGNNISSAWNYIIRRFVDIHGYCLVMSNDVVVMDGEFSWFNKYNLMDRGIIYPVDMNNEKELPYSCFIIYKWLFDKIGPFDEKLSVAENDNDYILRCKEIGINPYHENNLVINHLGRMSLDDLRKARYTEFSEEFYRLLEESGSHFARKWSNKGYTSE